MAPGAGSTGFDPDALADLEEQRDFLLRSLDDLEAERAAGDIDDDDYRNLKDDYTHRAADVLRAIDARRGVAGRSAARRGVAGRSAARRGVAGRSAARRGVAGRSEARRGVAGRAPTRRRPARTVIAVLLVAALAVGAGLAVAGSAGTRRPGETATGNAPLTLEQRLAVAARLAQQGQYTDALELYDEVIETDPANVEALSERGLLLVSLANATDRPQLAAEGRRSIEAALAVEPDNPRSLFYLGLAQRLLGDDAAARETFRQALAAGPDDTLRRTIDDFLATAGPGDTG